MKIDNNLPKEAVEEFKELYKKRFKRELNDEEATRRANNLFALYDAVYGIRKKSQCITKTFVNR